MINKDMLQLFVDKLDLNSMPNEIVSEFLASMIFYLDHGRSNDSLKGRTVDYLENKFDTLIKFYLVLGASKVDIVKVITNFPQILNIADVLYYKYLLLGVIENEDNTVRKDKFVNKPKDLMISLTMMYSRYKLISYSGYNKFTWNSMVHSNDREFARIFTKGIYKKPYQVFDSIEQAKKWIEINNVEFDLEEFKSLDVNKEFVEKYEKREFRI